MLVKVKPAAVNFRLSGLPARSAWPASSSSAPAKPRSTTFFSVARAPVRQQPTPRAREAPQGMDRTATAAERAADGAREAAVGAREAATAANLAANACLAMTKEVIEMVQEQTRPPAARARRIAGGHKGPMLSNDPSYSPGARGHRGAQERAPRPAGRVRGADQATEGVPGEHRQGSQGHGQQGRTRADSRRGHRRQRDGSEQHRRPHHRDSRELSGQIADAVAPLVAAGNQA